MKKVYNEVLSKEEAAELSQGRHWCESGGFWTPGMRRTRTLAWQTNQEVTESLGNLVKRSGGNTLITS